MQGGNHIGDAGAKSIAAVMNDISSLQNLSLVRQTFCNFPAEFEFLFYGDASGVTCAMQARNQIGGDGAKSIAAALKVNNSLWKLYLVRRT